MYKQNGFNLFTYCHQDYFRYFIKLGLDINEANHVKYFDYDYYYYDDI